MTVKQKEKLTEGLATATFVIVALVIGYYTLKLGSMWIQADTQNQATPGYYSD